MRRSLAFDTAPDGYAFGVIRRLGHCEFEYEESGGVTGLSKEEIVREARALYQRVAPDLLAVEGFSGFVSSARLLRMRRSLDISSLMDAAQVTGMLVAALPSPQSTVTLPANGANGDIHQWRYWLTGMYRQGDKGVALALDRMLRGGLPRRGKRKDGTPIYAVDNHQRDALGLALAAWLYTDYRQGPGRG